MADHDKSIKLRLCIDAGRFSDCLHCRSAGTTPYYIWIHAEDMGTHFHPVMVPLMKDNSSNHRVD